jgi:hypothetical protein
MARPEGSARCDQLHLAVIVDVITVNMVQPPVVDEVGMRSVLNARMFLARMPVGVVIGGHPRHQLLAFRMGRADLQRVFVKVPSVGVMQVAVMQKIDMAAVLDRLMAASLAVGVGIVAGMDHFMRQRRCGEKRECESSKKQGSVHENALQEE